MLLLIAEEEFKTGVFAFFGVSELIVSVGYYRYGGSPVDIWFLILFLTIQYATPAITTRPTTATPAPKLVIARPPSATYVAKLKFTKACPIKLIT